MIFISYAREDRAYASHLESELAEAAIPFLRDRSLPEGDAFWRCKIAAEIRACKLMLIISSCYAWASPWVEQEVHAFSGPKLFILLDDFPLPSEERNSPHTEVYRDKNVLECIKQRIPSTRVVSRSSDMEKDTVNETAIQKVRQHRLREETLRLARSLRILKGKKTNLDIGKDYALNRLDGSILRHIPTNDLISGAGNTLLYIGIEPVTNAQYTKFIQETRFVLPPPTWEHQDFSNPETPVVGINWFEATLYAAWVGGSLPTEEEWELAAREPDAHALYATSSGDIGPGEAYYAQPFGQGAPLPARTFPPNPSGFFNMCGNTWDWCNSSWNQHHVIRGGSYMDSALFCSIQARYRNSPIDRDCCISFRIKVEISPAEARSLQR